MMQLTWSIVLAMAAAEIGGALPLWRFLAVALCFGVIGYLCRDAEDQR